MLDSDCQYLQMVLKMTSLPKLKNLSLQLSIQFPPSWSWFLEKL